MNISEEKAELHHLLHLFLDIGEMMTGCGAEVNRVEDTLSRLGRAYGALRSNVFVITSSIVLTMEFPGGMEVTQTRRIEGAGSTDFYRLEKLNALSRECAADPLPLPELEEKIGEIRKDEGRDLEMLAGSVIAAAAFAVFFGGDVWDCLLAGAFAFPVFFLQKKLAPLCPNTVIFNLIAGVLVGTVTGLVRGPFAALSADKIIIGDIMLLIPGIAMTNSVRDVIVGDTISGIMRLIESILWAGALAVGYMLSMVIVGGAQPDPESPAACVQLAAAFAGSLGFAMIFKMRKGLLFPASFAGLLSWAVFLILQPHFHYMGVFIPGMIASAAGALYSQVFARIRKVPATLCAIPSVVPLIPGSGLYYTMSFAVQGEPYMMRAYARSTMEYAMAIAVGISLVWAAFVMEEKIRERRKR